MSDKKQDRIDFLDYLDKKGLLYASEKDELENLKAVEVIKEKEEARRKAIEDYYKEKKEK